MYDTHVKSGSARKVRRFWNKCQDIPHTETIHRTANKLGQTG
jgi:hypothetical protein